MRSLLLVASLLLASLSAVCGQSYYSFCYTSTQTNPNSPTLPWSVSMSGTLSVNDAASALTQGTYAWYLAIFPASQQLSGYPVINATGTRTIYAMGMTQTSQITGVAPINAYNGNDNIIRTTAPYFDNLAHSITFTLDKSAANPPLFATGTIASRGVVQGNPNYVNINNYTYPLYGGTGVQESDDPPNDGVANRMVSMFTLTPSTTYSATPSCGSNVAVNPGAAPASFGTTLSWSFCYTFTGGGNFATTNGQQWFTTASGTITTTGFAGTTTAGRTAYLITGMSGTRTYTNAGTGAAQTVNIVGVGGPNTNQAVAYYSEEFDYLTQAGLEADLSNNLLYSSYPYLDTWGVSVITDAFIGNEDQGNLTVNAFRLWVDPSSWSFNEWVTDFTAGYWYFTYSANAIVVPSANMTSGQLAPMCSPTYSPTGSAVLFQFCYYIDNMASTTNPSFSYAYGTMTATGPVMRNGRMAYTAQTMNGVRSITTGGVTNSSAIIYLEWIQSDLNWGFINNNLVYMNAPYIDQQGIIFATSQGPVFANGALPANTEVYYGYTDVAVAANTVGSNSAGNNAGIYEQSVLNPNYYTQGRATSAFNVAPLAYGALPSTSTCAYSGSNSAYITPITTTTFSFCYAVNGADNGGWQTYTTGTITRYNTPIVAPGGLLAYAIQNITGTRTYQDSTGATSTVMITGINSNNQGADGWVYDNLLYAAAPYFDSDGLVYDFAGTAQTAYGPVKGDGINTINIFVYTGFFQEEFYTATDLSVYGDVVGVGSNSFTLVQDNGAATAAGTVLAQCGVTSTSTAYKATTTQFGFCYAISNNLATSPYLPWSVVTTGTFTVVSNSYSVGLYQQAAEYPGYLITGGTGTRTVTSAAYATAQSQTITVAPINTYNTNDNILQPAAAAYGPAPAAPLLSLHGITFSTSGAMAQPQGTINTVSGPLSWVTLIGWQSPSPPTSNGSMPITEADLPLNDGVTGQVVAMMLVNYNGPTAPTGCVGGSSPVQVPAPSASLASTVASTVNYQFCYYFTGWDHLGTNWTIATSGTLTTSGYLGTTTNNLQARLVTGMTGSRVLTLGNGTQFITPLQGIGGFNAYQFVAENTNNEQFSSYFEANNILYMQWPYFDQYGLSLQGTGVFYEPNGGGLNTGNTALKLFIDPSTYDVAEWLIDWPQNTYYVGEAGSLQVSPSSSVSNPTDFYAQCQANYGALITYQWCYYADRSGGNGPNRYYVQAYGTLTASGPVTRQGQQAYTVQSMTGVRTYYNVTSGTSSTNPIVALQYINYDEGNGGGGGLTFWVTNDNYVFSASPYLDQSGIIYKTFPTPNNPQFSQGVAAGSDVQINVNQTFRNGQNLAFQENGVGTESTSTNAASASTISTNFGFSMTQGGLSSTSTCSAQSTRFQYPSQMTYSFCYVISGVGSGNTNFTVSSSGTITVYNVNVTSTLQYPNVPASIIAGVTGYRQWQDSTGNTSYVTITGLGSNWYAEDGWNYNQLLYNNSYSFDAYGLLFTFSGSANSPLGAIYGDVNSAVINIFNDGNGFQEEGWTGHFSAAYDIGVGTGSNTTFQLVSDGGNSYRSGSLLRGQCGFGGSIPNGFGPNGNYGSGSSGLSGGAIAGIVIGSVVGAVLLCVLLFLAVVGCGGRGKGGKDVESSTSKPNGKYSTQSEESRAEQSQVELADTNETS